MPWMHSPCLTSKAMENCIQLFALKVLPREPLVDRRSKVCSNSSPITEFDG